jgi:hypothetical protein
MYECREHSLSRHETKGDHMKTRNGTTLMLGGTGKGVQQALGRGPKDFRDYVRDAAAVGAWQS